MQPRTTTSSTRQATLLHALALVAAIGLGTELQVTRGQGTLLNVVAENFDGQAQDIAAQPTAGALAAAGKRAWVAQGRTRAAFKLINGQRVPGEDRRFPTNIVPDPEALLALEVDDVTSRLWTLSESTLYVETYDGQLVANAKPAAPALIASIDLSGYVHPSIPPTYSWTSLDTDSLLDFKLSPVDASIAYILTERRLLVAQLSGSGSSWILTVTATMDDLFKEGPDEFAMKWIHAPQADPAADDLKFGRFARLRIVYDPPTGTEPGRVMGFLTSAAQGYLLQGLGLGRPGPAGAVACWLDRVQGSQLSPTLFSTSQGSQGSLVYYNAIPYLPSDPLITAIDVAKNSVLSIDAFADVADGDEIKIAVGTGSAGQFQLVKATNCFESNSLSSPVCKHDIVPGQDIRAVFVDRLTPERAYVVTASGFWVHTWTTNVGNCPSAYTSAVALDDPVGKVHRDLVHVTWPNIWTAKTIWTAGFSTTDHVCKVFNVTPSGATGSPPSVVAEFYNMSSADGGVAIADANHSDVYLPTFGGVVRYTYDGAKFDAVSTSYQPAELANEHGDVDNTEHIDLATGIPGLRPTRLVTASARGDFMEFEINPITRDPDPAARWKPSNTDPVLASMNVRVRRHQVVGARAVD